VFVCTSRIESFPRVVLEAMAYGLPVVSTRVFGIAEQVGENVNALLYDPGDASRLAAHLRHWSTTMPSANACRPIQRTSCQRSTRSMKWSRLMPWRFAKRR
jgi:glycosyltransferase involved in cell wall biosynthesis